MSTLETQPVEASVPLEERRFQPPYFSISNRAARFVWGITWILFFRGSPRPLHGWRALLLKLFGAKLGARCHIYPGAKIWAPWNLECGDRVAIADGAEIYNPSTIQLCDDAIVSQGAYLCGASHDYREISFPLVTAPIVLEKRAWVAARAIVTMGVRLGEGCVIGTGSVVTTDMPAWSVCAGNPCRVIRPHYERK
jgi:putative colanic acid biosynthesis acetyltransferase WcaF